MKALNLGCGPRIFPDPWVNADKLAGIGADVLVNIDMVWPWEKDTFDQIWANHVLEHGKDICTVIGWLHFISKPGALVQVNVPIHSWTGFWDDPTHHSCWTPQTFTWFQQGHTHHDALPFKDGPEFRLLRFELRDGWELSWDLQVVKPGAPDSAEPPIPIPGV